VDKRADFPAPFSGEQLQVAECAWSYAKTFNQEWVLTNIMQVEERVAPTVGSMTDWQYVEIFMKKVFSICGHTDGGESFLHALFYVKYVLGT